MVGIVGLEIFNGLLERHKSFYTERLIEGKIGLVGNAVRSGGIDDGFIESKNRIVIVENMSRQRKERFVFMWFGNSDLFIVYFC